mgnify:FL=1
MRLQAPTEEHAAPSLSVLDERGDDVRASGLADDLVGHKDGERRSRDEVREGNEGGGGAGEGGALADRIAKKEVVVLEGCAEVEVEDRSAGESSGRAAVGLVCGPVFLRKKRQLRRDCARRGASTFWCSVKQYLRIV